MLTETQLEILQWGIIIWLVLWVTTLRIAIQRLVKIINKNIKDIEKLKSKSNE